MFDILYLFNLTLSDELPSIEIKWLGPSTLRTIPVCPPPSRDLIKIWPALTNDGFDAAADAKILWAFGVCAQKYWVPPVLVNGFLTPFLSQNSLNIE